MDCWSSSARPSSRSTRLTLRVRPSFFPFTEPSAGMDISCDRACRGEIKFGAGDDWLEIGGCGMVHPQRAATIAASIPSEYQGFAFGFGLDRMAMLKYGMPDLRAFFESDLRWLRHYGFLPRSTSRPSAGGAERDEVHALLAEGASRHRCAARRDRRDADHASASKSKRVEDPARALAAFRSRASSRPSSIPMPTGCASAWSIPATGDGAGRLRRAQRARRHEGRVRAARDVSFPAAA